MIMDLAWTMHINKEYINIIYNRIFKSKMFLLFLYSKEYFAVLPVINLSYSFKHKWQLLKHFVMTK